MYERPNSEFVARFIGASNVLKVQHLGGTRVDLNGHALDVGQGDFAGSGKTMSLCVKTHDIELLPDPRTSTDNTLPGVVRSQSYLGSHRDYIVDVGQEVLIAAPVHLDVPTHDYQDVVEGWETHYWGPWRRYLAG